MAMPIPSARHFILFASVMLAILGRVGTALAETATPPDHAEKMARGQEIFAKSVRALLTDRCLKCHGGEKTRSGLDLTTREGLLKGGEKGLAVVVGQAKASRLFRFIAHLDEPFMPPKEDKLSDAAIAQFATWIDLGAPYDKPLVAKAGGKKPMQVTDDNRRYWAFQPLKRPSEPTVKDAKWRRTPIDSFVLAKLEEKGLAPNAPADRRHLIRRAYLDLLGLPPSPEEVESFVADPATDAYEKLIDRLLDNPHYGERWARHWLDLAHYADSHGYEQDYDRPTAYPYRDFVIKAFNQDLAYNTFVKWQLAGDEFEPDNSLALTATGFLGAGTHATQITQNQVEKERYDELDDIVRTTGTAMLGLTIGCARCHDHKFDPIPTRDYYRLMSTFTTTVRSDMDVNLYPEAVKATRAVFDAEQVKLVDARTQYEKKGGHNTDPQWMELTKQIEEHAKKGPPNAVKAMVCSEGVPAIRFHTQGGDFLPETHFLKRGDPNQKDGVATQGFLQVLMLGADQEKRWETGPPKGWRTSYRRRSLANWMTDVDDGAGRLLARVIVNRLWQHHFGRGIVATPSDFGTQGDKPTHPELLDWLAKELIDSGWKLKHIHKLMMASAAYTESSADDKPKAGVDPDDRLQWRFAPRRLEAEAVRDSILTVSGQLDPTMYGPGTLDPMQKRRAIYFTIKRSQLIPMMTQFDAPDSLVGIEARQSTTVAPQALLLMNNALVRNCAERLANRVRPTTEKPLADAVRTGYTITLGRAPTEQETTDAVQFIKDQAEAYKQDGKPDAERLALTDLCQVLMELNEFIYVD